MREFVWNVLLVLDDTELADKAVECAIDLYLSGLKSKVYIFYVKDEEPVATPSDDAEKKKFAPMIAKAKKKILEAVEKLKTAGVDYEVVGYHIGIADEAVRRAEKEVEPDLIVLGAEKKGILKRLFEGNWTRNTIFETNAPVIVVKASYTPKITEIIKEVPVVEVSEEERLKIEG